MLSEDFDKKIRDAAEHHHAAYDEKAWMKMEKLLDKHLPVEEEKKRRFLFILLFFLLLGGGTWLYFGMQGKGGNTRNLAGTNNEKLENKVKVEDGNKVKGDQKIGQKQKENNEELVRENIVQDQDKDLLRAAPNAKDKGNPAVTNGIESSRNNLPGLPAMGKKLSNLAVVPKERKIPSPEKKTDVLTRKDPVNDLRADNIVAIKNDIPKIEVPVKKDENVIVTKDVAKDDTKQITTGITKTTVPGDKKEKDSKTTSRKKSSKASSFLISVSAGPDMSLVGLSEAGRVKLVGGAGVRYTRGHFTISSGFYKARKIYDAYPDDYHAPSAFYTYYPNLQKVKADCKVYEVPLAISYRFGKKTDHSWFASSGISTYFMKRETYNFFYKYTPTSPVVSKERTIYNSNEHWFSVLTLSGGYQKKINKTFSIAAEPYVKLPLTGIGFGKVKLNSAGILVSAIITPFHPKGKK